MLLFSSVDCKLQEKLLKEKILSRDEMRVNKIEAFVKRCLLLRHEVSGTQKAARLFCQGKIMTLEYSFIF